MPRIADATYTRLARWLAFHALRLPPSPPFAPRRVLTEQDRAGGTLGLTCMLAGMRQAEEESWIALFEFSDSPFKFVVLDELSL